MKKLLFALVLLILLLLTSCGKSIEEQMFYDYMNETTIKNLNMSVDDLDFKIISLKKADVVLAKDSISDYSESIIIIENGLKTNNDKLKKTLKNIKVSKQDLNKFIRDKSIKSKIDKRYATLYQEQIDNTKEIITIYEKMLKNQESKVNELQSFLDKAKSKLNLFNTEPEKIIGNKYEVTYSMFMPDTKLTNTFKGFALTNSENTQFVGIVF
tara:strand:+ start:321 stop:956 length:636 start_codon:yes stop_codon:yes gene_type:complete